MISRASAWRRGGPDGRESIPPAGAIDHSATANVSAQSFWGKKTSRPMPSQKEIEAVAAILGVSFAAAKRAIDQGLI